MAPRRPGNMKFAQRIDGAFSLLEREGVRETGMADFILGGGIPVAPAGLV